MKARGSETRNDDADHPQCRSRTEGRAPRARCPARPVDGRRVEPNPEGGARRREAAPGAQSGRGDPPAVPAVGRRRRDRAAPTGAGRRAAAVRAVIILDTNVLSELMRSQPTAAVFAWVPAQARAVLYTTSVNKAEILY